MNIEQATQVVTHRLELTTKEYEAIKEVLGKLSRPVMDSWGIGDMFLIIGTMYDQMNASNK